MKKVYSCAMLAMCLLGTTSASGVHFNATGHFGLKGISRTEPIGGTGTYLAMERDFQLMAEARINEDISVYLDTRIWVYPENEFYYGNTAATTTACSDGSEACAEPFTGDSTYTPFDLTAQKAFARIGTDYCILEVGRRGRDWGMGIYLDAGNDPYDFEASVYDGLSCDVNIQKTQTLGFELGFDKISEGTPYYRGDDINQFYLSIELDDRQSASSTTSKYVGLYAANISSANDDNIGEIGYNIFDLYTGLYFGNFFFEGEAIFRTGDSNESKWSGLGAKATDTAVVDSIALALRAEWAFINTGTSVGIKPYVTGNASRHLATFEYFRAPGDSSGYYKGTDLNVGVSGRDSEAEAFYFHRNFKPALILFNGRDGEARLNIDGIYEHDKIVNANVFTVGYRFESLEIGTLEAKLITAQMIETMPSDVSAFFDSNVAPADYYNLAGDYPVGYFGSDLGTEIDVTFTTRVSQLVELSLATGYLFTGAALQTTDESPDNSWAVEGSVIVSF